MLFGSTAPLPALILWCRAIRHGLDVLSPVRVFRQQATSGPSSLRDVAARVADRLAAGDSLDAAFKPEARRFPPIFLEMVAVGEHAGRLPDVFAELEEHFEAVKDARQAFLRVLTWPVLQYFAAILVIAFVIFVLGLLGAGVAPIGFGLTGAKGAVLFLIAAAAFTAGVVGVVWFVATSRQIRDAAESAGLQVPVIGECFRAFALSRFCTAYHMTAEAGMRADRCLRFSLRATANQAYIKEAEPAARAARKGQGIPEILGGCGPRLFPEDFMTTLHVGDESGRLAEVMKQQAVYYRDEAARKLKLLARVAGGLVYTAIGILIIYSGYRMFTQTVTPAYNSAFQAADDPDAWLRGGR